MKKTVLVRMMALAFIGVLFAGHLWAQEDKSKRPSPPATATGNVHGATITINYSSPSVKGRKIWGGLVPYDKVWRAGANEATIFTTDKDIMVEGKKLAAGKYSLFTTPGEKEWTVFFNSETGQWGDTHNGDANMDPKKTVLEVKVTPKMLSSVQESLLYSVTAGGFTLSWDKLAVPVSIK
ncbi:MAG TPA: hypothetical protein DIC22_03495 [Chitinophagaceae bacterium]|jgi:hypothetical protein|nr:hypothetical protein [Chitinophagaceae bacterium]